jgi:hypothetical protein
MIGWFEALDNWGENCALTHSCPSYRWNPDRYLGPAILLQSYRWLADTRNQHAGKGLDRLEDPFRLSTWRSASGLVDQPYVEQRMRIVARELNRDEASAS